jgi:hypothetical protein
VAIPDLPEFQRVKEAVVAGVQNANFRPVSVDENIYRFGLIQEKLFEDLAHSECIVADITNRNPNVFFVLGVAQAMGKGLFLLLRKSETKDAVESIPFDFRVFPIFVYDPRSRSLSSLVEETSKYLRRFRQLPRSPMRMFPRPYSDGF